MGSLKKVAIKTGKIIGFIVLGIIALLIVVVVLIRLPGVQNKIVGKVEKYLQDTLQTQVNIESAFVGFPNSIELEGVYLEDRAGDTLLYIGEASVNTDLWGLLESKIDLSSIEVNELVARVVKLEDDSTYNFSFIIEIFATEPAAEDTTSSAMEIRIGDVELSDFDITYEEKKTQLQASLGWSGLLVELENLDPTGTSFHARNIQLTGAAINFDDGMAATDTTSASSKGQVAAEPLDYVFQIDELGIDESRILFNSETLKADAFIQKFGLEDTHVDMAKSAVAMAAMTLLESEIDVEIPQTGAIETTTNKPAAEDSVASDADSPAWTVKLDELKLEGNAIAYNVDGAEELPGFDPNHLNITALSVDVSDIVYEGAMAQADISSFTFSIGDAFTLFDTGADFYMDDTTLRVEEIDIHTRESHIRGQLAMHFTSIEEIASGNTRVNVSMNNSYIHPADLLYFDSHALDSVPIRKPFNFPLSFEVNVEGIVADLDIATLEIKLLSETQLDIAGNLKGLPEADDIRFDFHKIDLKSSRQNITRLLADSLIPESIRLPERFGLQASASGATDDLTATATFASSYGDFKLNASYNAGGAKPAYDLAVSTAGFNLGSFILDTANFQQLALDISVTGTGIDPDSIEAKIEGQIVEMDYQNYVYNDIMIDGELSSTLFSGELSIDDENLQFTFTGDIDYGSEEMSYKIDLDLDYADLEALNFSKTPLILRTKINSDIQTEDFTKFTGNFAIREFSANNGIGTYRVDSLLFASIEQEGQTEITIDSDMMGGYFRGDIDVASLPAVLSQHIDRYYDLEDYDELKADSIQQFEFFLDLKKTDLLTEILVPGLQSIDPGVFEGSFDSEKHELSVTFSINEMVYNDITIDSLFIVLESDTDELNTEINLNKLTTTNAVLHGFDFDGILRNNIYHIRLEVPDTAGAPAYLVKGNFESLEAASYRFEIEPDTLILAFTKWVARESNYLLFREQGFSAHNFELTSGEQSISVEGTVAQDSLARIVFENFSLGGLANALKKEDEILLGTLDGNVALTLLQDTYDIDAALQIAGLGFLGQKWGDLNIEAANGGTTAYDVNVTLRGPNDATIIGVYDTDSAATNPIDFAVELEQLNLALFDPIVGESVRDLEGTLRGSLKITGSATAPEIDGEMRFTNTFFTPGMLNSRLTIDDERLRFRNSTLSFDNFQFSDANENTASIDGTLEIENTSFYRFDLSMQAENFQVLNTTKEDNEMYFGNLSINADASVTGTSARPTVNFDLEVMNGSELTYVLIESQEQVLNQPNVVQFVNPNDTLELSQNPDAADSLSYAFQGMELTANIELHDNSTLKMVIDPITQDQLTVQGNANLSVEMNRNGDLQLTGRYTLTEGAYQLSFYQVLKRNFTIEEGSTITWTGDPLNARLDITASTIVEAQPIDLLANQISSTNTTEMNRYRQRLPFEVALNIEGNLSQPEISFGLDMPDANRSALEGSVYAKIQEINTRESDLNKQVFALLVLKRFVAENPLASAGGTSLEDNARRSVSRLLSDQLNKLTDDVGGVQLDVNVESYEDYSSGEAENRTDLELGVSKSLFDERLTVKVAGNVALEGSRQSQDDVSDYIGDLLLEYKLTEDGRLRLLGFRRNEFDVVNGEIIETGTGLIYVRDYDKFKELFNLNEKEEE